jgi:hypothetical protein
LEDKEWGNCVFLEEFGEGWNRNVKGVVTIVLMYSRKLGSRGYASGLLKVSEKRFGLRIDSVGQRLEGICFRIVEESALLEEEGCVFLATSLIIVKTVFHFLDDLRCL